MAFTVMAPCNSGLSSCGLASHGLSSYARTAVCARFLCATSLLASVHIRTFVCARAQLHTRMRVRVRVHIIYKYTLAPTHAKGGSHPKS